MKRTQLILFALCGSVLVCMGKAVLLETPGTITSPSGNWKVEILKDDPGLRVTTLTSTRDDGVTVNSEISPQGWSTYPNAFVYIDEDDVVWAYDGQSRVLIFQIPDSDCGCAVWMLSTWTNGIPDLVKQRTNN